MKKLLALFTLVLALCSFALMAQEVPSIPTTSWIDGLFSFLFGWANQYPKAAPIMATLYLVGVGVKLLREAVSNFVLQSPSLSDDEKWKKAQENKIVKSVMFVMDLFLRLKNPAKK